MNSAQMVVLTDNVVVFCLNINKDLEMSKLKKATQGGFFLIILQTLIRVSAYKSRFNLTPARIHRPG